MLNVQPGGPGAFEAIVEPWLELDGVKTAALASTDGLLIAAAGVYDREIEALAANCATVLAAARGLADNSQAPPRMITIDTAGQGIILAPLGRELFLIIAGQRAVLLLAGNSGLSGLMPRQG